MAVSSFKYCTQRDVKDVYPNIDEADNKVVVRNWVQESTLDDYGGTSNLNIWYSYNTGLVTQLFKDGAEITNITSNLDTHKTLLNGAITNSASGATVDSTTGMEQWDLIKIGNEYIRVTAVTDGTTLGFTSRNLFNTHSLAHANDSKIYLAVNESDVENSDYNWFLYDKDLDVCILAMPSDVDPNEKLIEAGEDWATLIDRMIVNCSMELSAMLDARFPRPIPKSYQYAEATDGSDTPEYDYIIKRATALLVAHHLLVSKDPIDETALALKEELDEMIDRLNTGKLKLAFEVDATDQSGDIVEVTRAGTMYLVETSGSWVGAPYDRVKIKCVTGGVYGTAKVDIFALSGNALYGSKIWEGCIVTGGLQELSGLWFRFEGNSMSVDDEWHVVVRNFAMNSTNSGVRSIRATHTYRVGKNRGEE